MITDQVDDRNLRATQFGSKLDDIVEIGLSLGVEYVISVQGSQAFGLVRVLGCEHRPSSLVFMPLH